MNGLLLALPFLLAGAPDEEERPYGPDPKLVAEAVTDLRAAFERGDPKARVQAIERRSEVLAPEVVEWIAKGLKLETEPEVRSAALGALRWMELPDALEVLHETYARRKEFRKDAELHVALLKAIGQHGKASSIECLMDESPKDSTGPVRQARVLGLGRIRSKESVESLFELMRTFGPRQLRPHMEDFRLSLVMLSGDDHGGSSPEKWTAWWNENKKTFAVPEQAPKLPDGMQRAWNSYWDLQVTYERPERRRERGGGL